MGKLIIKKNYGTAPNDLLNSTTLSLKAKGLFAHLQSKPDGWDFSTRGIASQSKDGISSVRNGLQELERAGYLRRKAYKENGLWAGYNYTLYDKPSLGFRTTENRTSPNSDTISKQEVSKKEKEKKIQQMNVLKMRQKLTAVKKMPYE